MSSRDEAFHRFCDACRRGDKQEVQELLASIDDINAQTGFDARTPLMRAAESKNADLVRFLLDNGASVDRSDDYRRTALHTAARVENNVDVLRLLIERGADVNAIDCDKWCPVEYAFDVANFRCLLEAGSDPERALVAATRERLDEIVDQLIDSGVDVDARGRYRWTALMQASTVETNTETMRMRMRLLAYGADVNLFSDDHRWTALGFTVARHLHAPCIQLLASGADVNVAGVDGVMPLRHALQFNNHKLVLPLLAAGADVHAAAEKGAVNIWNTDGAQRRDIQCLLVAAGAKDCPVSFTEDELDNALAEIAAAKNEIEAARRQLKAERHALVVKKALPVCIGLQSLELPAFVTSTNCCPVD